MQDPKALYKLMEDLKRGTGNKAFYKFGLRGITGLKNEDINLLVEAFEKVGTPEEFSRIISSSSISSKDISIPEQSIDKLKSGIQNEENHYAAGCTFLCSSMLSQD